MNIFNIRHGFATNSSSSHSVVFLPKETTSVKEDSLGQFGWEWFFLTEKEDKLRYLAVQNAGNFPDFIMEDLFGFVPDKNSYIDHESVGTVISSSNLDKIIKEIEFVSNPKVAILGGNDNSDVPDRYSHLKEFPKYEYMNGFYKKEGDVIVIFNKENGTKIRFSENPNIKSYNRSLTPELVDMKITDYCAMGCEYCYQGSTKEGKHASFSDIKNIVDALAKEKVFEIALGGGETTEHPNFIDIVKYISEKGIVPNFTTRNTKWAKVPENVDIITDSIGKFAVSIDSVKELEKYYETFSNIHSKTYNYLSNYMTAQVVMGAISKESFIEIIEFCQEKEIPLTLLGYKTTGRGQNVIPIDYSWWLDIVMEQIEISKHNYNTNFTVGIDTEIVRLFKDKLINNNVPELYFTSIEGAFSCYIDAVEMNISKSSYEENPESYIPFTKESWLDTYQNFELSDNIPVLIE